MKYSQQHRPRFFKFDQAGVFNLLGTGPPNRTFKRINDQVGQSQRKKSNKNERATAETIENEESKAGGDEEREPDICTADHTHEQVERGRRPLFIDQVKYGFVHAVAACENRSARAMKQATLAILLALAGTSLDAQNFPDAQQILANVRLQQSSQQIDLHGQLRQEAKIVPFQLVQNGPVIRYIFDNPDETLQLRLEANGTRLQEIKRSRTSAVSSAQLSEPVRGTALSYEDLALGFLYWPNARVVGADFIRTRNCWRMQLQAPANQSQYGSITLWVDKDSGALMRMEGFDRAGKLSKRFEVVSAQKIEDHWFLKQMRVEAIDPQTHAVALRTYLEINKGG